MRAMAIHQFGDPEALRPMALPRPVPGRGEILIRAVAAGVSRVDCMIRAGRLEGDIPHEFPLIPGWDVAGVIEALGDGAGGFRKGDSVFACARKPTAKWGCYAEYVSVPQDDIAAMPAKLLFEEAASVPLSALAAHQCLSAGSGIGDGAGVLIHGAAGGVGHFAIQLARQAGARVYGTASAESHSFILGMGAHVAIDSRRDDFRDAVRRDDAEGVDVVLDLIGGETLAQSYEVVKPGGRLVSLVEEPDAEAASARDISVSSCFVSPSGEQLARIARMFDAQELRTHVQKIYPLGKAAEAHETLEKGHVQGKLVLNL